jgi:hypothetical protein
MQVEALAATHQSSMTTNTSLTDWQPVEPHAVTYVYTYTYITRCQERAWPCTGIYVLVQSNQKQMLTTVYEKRAKRPCLEIAVVSASWCPMVIGSGNLPSPSHLSRCIQYTIAFASHRSWHKLSYTTLASFTHVAKLRWTNTGCCHVKHRTHNHTLKHVRAVHAEIPSHLKSLQYFCLRRIW